MRGREETYGPLRAARNQRRTPFVRRGALVRDAGERGSMDMCERLCVVRGGMKWLVWFFIFWICEVEWVVIDED